MAPPLPEGVDVTELDRTVQRELAGLPAGLAELIGKHLAAAFQLLEDEPLVALEHARFIRSRAARVAVVREAAGVVAYQAEEWAEALSELRTARRLGGGPGLLAIMADCERALGRPERALDLARSPEARQLDAEESAELRIVAAGARRDLGQDEAAVVGLQGSDLDERRRDPWSARLFYAYADNLEAVGRTEEATRWFIAAADADEDGETDAGERAAALGNAELGDVESDDAQPGGERAAALGNAELGDVESDDAQPGDVESGDTASVDVESGEAELDTAHGREADDAPVESATDQGERVAASDDAAPSDAEPGDAPGRDADEAVDESAQGASDEDTSTVDGAGSGEATARSVTADDSELDEPHVASTPALDAGEPGDVERAGSEVPSAVTAGGGESDDGGPVDSTPVAGVEAEGAPARERGGFMPAFLAPDVHDGTDATPDDAPHESDDMGVDRRS